MIYQMHDRQILVLLAVVAAAAAVLTLRRSTGLVRLRGLYGLSGRVRKQALCGSAVFLDTPDLKSRFSRAGAIDRSARKRLSVVLAVLVCSGIAGGGAAAFALKSAPMPAAFLLAFGLLIGSAAALLELKRRERRVEQSILFGLPVILEQMVLLIEAGLGLLPALHRLMKDSRARGGPVEPIFASLELIYGLCGSGIPFATAVAEVADAVTNRPLRHVLLHLDIGASEGGELIPALRGLADHCHREWSHSVQARIKRLENTVIFPVFVSVVGLMVLVAAVPLVPVLELRQRLETTSIATGDNLAPPVGQ